MRLRFATTIALVTGCASNIRYDVVGNGTAPVLPRGAAAPAPAGGIALARGQYRFALTFDVPRAQIVEWTVSCPGSEQHGTVGETFESYRERRLVELKRQRERDRQNVAAVSGAIIGAVAPDVHARGQATTPNSQATVDAHVSGQAVGAAAGTAIADATAQPEVIELAPGDVGATRLQARVHVAFATDGACSISAVADDHNVLALYKIERIRDLAQERREKQIAAQGASIQVRGQLTASLVAQGADVTLRQRRLDEIARVNAEAARARAEAEAQAARARAEAQAEADRIRAARAEELRIKAQADAQVRAEADRVRAEEARIKAEAEARVRLQAERERAERLRIQAEAEARVRMQAQLKVRVKIDAALQTRSYLIAYLTGECKADPHRRERIAQQQQAEREQRLRIEAELRLERERVAELKRQEQLRIDAQLRIEHDRLQAIRRAEREKIEAQRRAERERIEEQRRREAEVRRYEAEQRRIAEEQRRREAELVIVRRQEAAIAVRGELQTYLVSLGARLRPPRPAPIFENPGAPPFDGAAWIAGSWRWTGGQWIWEAGGWHDTHVIGTASTTVDNSDTGGGSVAGGIAGAIVDIAVGASSSSSSSSNVRDHRSGASSSSGSSGPTVRDHRSGSSSGTSTSAPTVRDHRSGSSSSGSSSSSSSSGSSGSSSSSSSPTVRDHRKDKKDDDDKKSAPTVRDHRRR